jgi:two-component system, OmpR family, phosphate regulon response regulator OmpR
MLQNISNNTPLNGSSRKILIVDDDPRLRDLLKRYLTEQGFLVYSAENARDMQKYWQRDIFDLLVLDVMMPEEDGFSICRRLRSVNDLTPIIMLTAKAQSHDRIAGLELGADDYLSKPFNPRELLARIHAVLRRKPSDEHPGAPTQEPESVSFGTFTLNLSNRTLHCADKPVALTTGEFSVLKVFARNPRIALSREKLMELARGREHAAFNRSLDVQISRLRRLIEPNPSKPQFIQTVWGLGYVFVPHGDL